MDTSQKSSTPAVSASPTSTSQKTSMKQNPRPKQFSRGKKTGGTTGSTSNSSTQRPNDQSRNAKRARWAKQNKPKAKPVAPKVNAKEYISLCCSVPARKPVAGQKMVAKDPESGKMKSAPKGLGHWHCGQCGKPCKVSAQKPTPKELMSSVRAADVPLILNMGSSVPREAKIFPAMVPIATEFNPPALETIVLKESFPVAPPGVIARVVTFGGNNAAKVD